jgi:polyphenol oxidase
VKASVASRQIGILEPDWPVPPRVRAAFTLRSGGVSGPPYDSLNVGMQVGDSAEAVRENRGRIRMTLGLPAEPAWLEQIHGTNVLELEERRQKGKLESAAADAVLTRCSRQVCVIQVADCLPILIAAQDGSAVAAVHAGWRGLAAGVIEAALAKLAVSPARLCAWLGPAIGRHHFEVGDEVRAAFIAQVDRASSALALNERGRWQCDLAGLARLRLAAAGVASVFGGGWCTYSDRTRFFSYRRDGRCGRMAALIWLAG